MQDKPNSSTPDTGMDIASRLQYLMGDTGGLHESMGGFRIDVFHNKGFPWADVFKILLDQSYRVYVTRRKADVRIEASF